MDLDIDGLRVYWREEGRGPTVVLVHGCFRSSASFRRTIAGLAATHRVLAPDLPGLGRSDKPLHGLAFPAVAEVLRGWLDRVAGDSYALLGQGCGGPLALAAARPERVTAVVLANATLRVRSPRRILRAPLAAARWWRATSDEDRRSLASRGGRRTALALARGDGLADLLPAALACALVPRPTLLLWDGGDRWLGERELRWLRRTLPGAGVARVPATGFTEALGAFLGGPLVSSR